MAGSLIQEEFRVWENGTVYLSYMPAVSQLKTQVWGDLVAIVSDPVMVG